MVKGMIVAGCAALSITMIGGQAAQAQAVAPPIAQSAPEFDAFDQAMAAKRVADFGRRQHDPEALLVAARMLQEVPFRDKAAGPAGVLSSAFGLGLVRIVQDV